MMSELMPPISPVETALYAEMTDKVGDFEPASWKAAQAGAARRGSN